MSVLFRRCRWFIAAFIAVVLVGAMTAPARADSTGIEGTITDAKTGDPVAGAWVEAFNSSGGNSGGANTDESGHYDLFWLRPGEYRIKVVATDYHDQWAFDRSEQASADPVASPGTASLRLKPVEYGSISGRFTTASGSGVAGAAVEVFDASGNQRDRQITDGDGAFRFPRLEPGDYRLSFDSNGNLQWAHGKPHQDQADPITVRPGEETTVTETAFPTGDIEVSVVDSRTRKPLAGATVATREGPRTLSGVTGAEGKVSFDDVLTGTYSFSIAPPEGYLYGTIDDVVVRADATASVTGRLMREALIVLTFRDSRTAEPVPGACVTLFGPQAATTKAAARKRGRGSLSEECSDASGTLRLPQLPPGRYRLFITPTDGVHGRQWVGANGGTGDMEKAAWFTLTSGRVVRSGVRMDAAGAITGTVTDARTGKPVEDVCAWVQPAGPSGPDVWERNCTGSGGRYTIDGLGPYDWRVQYPDFHGRYVWQWSGGAPDRFAARPVRVVAGRTATADARLPQTGKMTGKVIGAVVPNEYVTVVAVSARTGDIAAPWATVTGDAEYALYGLATQWIRLGYSGGPGDLIWYPRPLHVVAGETSNGPDLVVPKE
ncbi:carboxypeptidase regulatory-like domain-containing protein [Actinomadura sp. 3N508]|uniref:carboxypeptidase regulatory-like domain-containing protein n=1 Tax=Actinomadura sp. 3N508 TaxID=3375153 RepID=UPI0037A0ED45